ncbi:MAG: hypothetical protein NTAFB01_25600 [Nitrospira sp.]
MELITKLEVLKNVLNVLREAIEVVLEIGEQLLPAAAGLEIAQSKLRGVVESLARSITERRALLSDACHIEHLLGVQHLLLGRLEHRIHAPDDAHRQNHIRILAPLKQIPKDIIRNTPDKGDNLVMSGLIHQKICFKYSIPYW